MLDITGDDARQVARHLTDASEYVGRLGARENPESAQAFRFLRAGRLMPAQHQVAIVNNDPPFLRVFRPDGDVVWTAAPEGGGPGEARYPLGVAVAPDGRVLLLHDFGKVSEFGPDGVYSAGYRFQDGLTLAVGSGCGQEWTVYGPSSFENDREVPWLRSLSFTEDGPTITDLWRDEAPSRTPLMVERYQLAMLEREVYFDHPFGPRRGLLSWSCEAGHIRIRDDRTIPARYTPDAPGPDGEPSVVSVGLRIDRPYPVGRADLPDGGTLRFFRRAWDPRTKHPSTFIRVQRGDTVVQVIVPGSYKILDASADGLALVAHNTDLLVEALVIRGQRLAAALWSARAGGKQAHDDSVFYGGDG